MTRFSRNHKKSAGLVLKKQYMFFLVVFIYMAGLFFFSWSSFLGDKAEAEKNMKLANELLVGDALALVGHSYHFGQHYLKMGSVQKSVVRKMTREMLSDRGVDFVYTAIYSDGRFDVTSKCGLQGYMSFDSKMADTVLPSEDDASAVMDSKPFFRLVDTSHGPFFCYYRPVTDGDVRFLVVSGNDYSDMNSSIGATFVKNAKTGIYFILLVLPFVLFFFYVNIRERKSLLSRIYMERLTGLPNRSKLLIDIGDKDTPSLAIVNIDSFKEYNEFYGYDFGDFVIMETVRRIDALIGKGELGKNTQMYKLQGDEFAVLFRADVPPSEMERYSLKIISAVTDNPLEYMGHEVPVSVTVGCSCADVIMRGGEKCGTTALISRADMALKRARKLKRHFLVYNESMNIWHEYSSNISTTLMLKHSIKNDRVVPHYQPIMNNVTGKIEKYESLARIISDDGEVIMPNSFMDVAMRSKLYPNITRIMMEKTCDYFASVRAGFSINLSAEDIASDETIDAVFDVIARYGEDLASRLIFEIVESERIDDFAKVASFIRRAKAAGCRIAIDDFGTGYSNYSCVGQLDVDFVKIDASLIRSLDRDSNCRLVAETIAGFCSRMGIKTVAEYVHSEEILALVKEMGIDYSQGYHIGKPAAGIPDGESGGDDES